MTNYAEKITCYTQQSPQKSNDDLYRKILAAAERHDITAGTVHQGSMPYPANDTALGHRTFGHNRSSLVLQFIDSTEKLSPFIEELTDMAQGTLITRERIEILSEGTL